MKIILYENPAQIGVALAERILAGLAQATAQNRDYVLGCPGGRSLMPVYEALAKALASSPQDCSRLIIAMMDEYLLADANGGLVQPPVSAHFSCAGFGERDIRERINAVLPGDMRIPSENLWLPSPQNPAGYETQLEEAGGVDLFLLASGAGDGHIAFNPPGSPWDSGSRIVALAEQTRRDNIATFPQFQSLDDVPRHGITIGTGSIARLSKAVAMVVWGEGKRLAFERLSRAQGYEPDWPATILTECRSPELHADYQAASGS